MGSFHRNSRPEWTWRGIQCQNPYHHSLSKAVQFKERNKNLLDLGRQPNTWAGI
jgi:hypothetical protein